MIIFTQTSTRVCLGDIYKYLPLLSFTLTSFCAPCQNPLSIQPLPKATHKYQSKKDTSHLQGFILHIRTGLLKARSHWAAATATATSTKEWATLDPMEVFTWRPAAKATSTHSVQYNPFFPLPLPQSVWTGLTSVQSITWKLLRLKIFHRHTEFSLLSIFFRNQNRWTPPDGLSYSYSKYWKAVVSPHNQPRRFLLIVHVWFPELIQRVDEKMNTDQMHQCMPNNMFQSTYLIRLWSVPRHQGHGDRTIFIRQS